MTFVLKGTGDPNDLPLLDERPPTWGETFQAGIDAERIEIDSWGLSNRVERQILDEMNDRLGPDPEPLAAPPIGSGQAETVERNRLLARMKAAQTQDPEAYLGMPTDIDQLTQLRDKRLREQYQDARDVLDMSSGGSAEFFGRMWAGVTDDATVLTLPIGAAGGARLGAVMLWEGLGGMAGEALTLPRQYQMSERLDIEDPNPVAQMAVAGVASAGLGGLLAAAPRALRYANERVIAAQMRRPVEMSVLKFEEELARQADTVANEQGLDMGRPEGGQPSIPYPVQEPANWSSIRNGIFAGESGGDYDALFSFQNRPGGRFENVRLTDMTVDEAIAFAAPGGEYASWVRGRIGRVATPMGAYQVVGTTLRKAKRGLGLTGQEKMSREVQDQIGIWIYRNQGTSAWVGYRGPRSDAPRPAAGPAPASGGFETYSTSRPYTATGEVTVGDDTRVRVEYEVVDLSDLRQATGDLQPRDRGRVASDAWVSETAARLDPAQLMDSPWADRGAPLVGPDGIIESGNGRVRAIERAYAQASDRADAYRRQIEERTGQAIPEGIERPVLVARRTSDLSDDARRQLVVDAQDSGVARMNATERARVGQQALDDNLMAKLEPGADLTSPANRNFARAFAGFFPRSERNAFIDEAGGLSIDGVRQIQDSLFARAYDAPDILARYAESAPGELRTMIDGLAAAAPALARLRAAIDAGHVRPEMDITPFVLDAARIITTARELARADGGKLADIVEELLAQVDLLDGAVAPLTAALVRKFAPNGRQVPAKSLGDFLTRYADEAMKAGRTGDALLEQPGPLDVLKALDRETFGELTETGQASRSDLASAPVDAPMPERAFNDGAASPEAEMGDAQAELELREPAPEDAELDAIADGLRRVEDNEFKNPDGPTFSLQDVLDDLDADADLEAALDACPTGRAA